MGNSISDIIENFILDALGQERELNISRNELANYFACSPSQINYVLETRFTLDRGFNKVSRRGGGGFIKITKIPVSDDAILSVVLNRVGDELSFNRAKQIVKNLVSEEVLKESDEKLILSLISDSALSSPFDLRDKIRAQQFKSMLVYLMENKGENDGRI
ncbi:MAG: CtsR family transcriptional regulator [bacterium]|nr:CtsR family transcriptional regulator [bacterium]